MLGLTNDFEAEWEQISAAGLQKPRAKIFLEAFKTADSGFIYVLNVSLNPFCLFVLTAGAALGAVNGLRMGLKETRDMAWSKPRNVQ